MRGVPVLLPDAREEGKRFLLALAGAAVPDEAGLLNDEFRAVFRAQGLIRELIGHGCMVPPASLEHETVELLLAAAQHHAVGAKLLGGQKRVDIRHLFLVDAHAAALDQPARSGV